MNRLASFSYTWTWQADAWVFRGGDSQQHFVLIQGLPIYPRK
ncbi:hypothetical protein PCO31110_02669 [Pandoraea communis]|uniref:Uncharacterized protein n=1 Tax=Pandoraea communis TaxID=2508297 RepID=A0A5E4VJP2_9BURK|nr:hypothetical protein PCO31110_02669 [Pandoraea communis]